MTVVEAVPLVLATVQGSSADVTLRKVGDALYRFTNWCSAQQLTSIHSISPALARQYVLAPLSSGALPQVATSHGRRAALRLLFRQLRSLGHDVGDPTLDLTLPTRPRRAARPLTDEELVLCRQSAQLRSASGGGYASTVLALAEATAVTSEITAARVADLDDPDRPRQVRLAGGARHDPRLGRLTDWGSAVLAARAARLRQHGASEHAPLAYAGHDRPGGVVSQSAACTSLRQVLNAAGLRADEQVRPASVRHWAGRTLYDSGQPLEEVARVLGLRSLDATAEDIDLRWRPEPDAGRDQEGAA